MVSPECIRSFLFLGVVLAAGLVAELLSSHFLQYTGTCTCLPLSQFDSRGESTLCQRILSSGIYDGVSRIRFTDTASRCSVPVKWIARQTSGIQGTYMPIRVYALILVQKPQARNVRFLCASVFLWTARICVTQTSGQWVVQNFVTRVPQFSAKFSAKSENPIALVCISNQLKIRNADLLDSITVRGLQLAAHALTPHEMISTVFHDTPLPGCPFVLHFSLPTNDQG